MENKIRLFRAVLKEMDMIVSVILAFAIFGDMPMVAPGQSRPGVYSVRVLYVSIKRNETKNR